MLVYVLFFGTGTGMVYAVIARKMARWSYKAGVGVALVAWFALAWSNIVHVADSENPANLVYYSVLAVGGLGAWLARLEARGLARTLFTMAATLAVIAVMLASGAAPDLARNMPSCMVPLWRCSWQQVHCSGTPVWPSWSKTEAGSKSAPASTCARLGRVYGNIAIAGHSAVLLHQEADGCLLRPVSPDLLAIRNLTGAMFHGSNLR